MSENRVKVSDLAKDAADVTLVDMLYYERPYVRRVDDYDEPAKGGDNLSWSQVCGVQYTGMFGHTVTIDTEDEKYQALLPIRGTGRGDYNGCSTYDRSNMEWLTETYPDTFITIGRSSHDGQQLALPLDAEIPEELAGMLLGLYEYSGPLNEEHHYQLEAELLTECWDSWIRSDFESMVQDRLAEVMQLDKYETDMDEYLEAQLKRRGLELRELFDAAMEASDTYPEWETSESCYIRDFELVARFAVANLMEMEN